LGKGTGSNAEQEIGNMERTVTVLRAIIGKQPRAKAVTYAFQLGAP